ncbi:MAG: ribbon-helix-helix protein, CopG family [Candidatus Sedimenticola endophacoides]
MAETKSTTLTVRVHPEVKEGLRAVAEKERRSLANMIEVMIRDYCSRAGVTLEEKTAAR